MPPLLPRRFCLRIPQYIITYGLGIYLLNLFIGFLSPPVSRAHCSCCVRRIAHTLARPSRALQMDPESDGPLLPTRSADEEYRPFQRRVSEFTFWLGATRAVFVAFVMTFFSVFNVPVFWPILLLYFLILFTLTMKNQIAHMIKYRYIPISWGKARYGGKGGKGGKPGDGKGGKDGSSSAAAAAFATGAAPDTRFSGSNLK